MGESLCASRLNQFDRAMELAGRIPLAPTAKAARIQIMGQGGRWRELIDAFQNEDIDRWPAPFQGDAFHARGAAYFRTKDGRRAEADLKVLATALRGSGHDGILTSRQLPNNPLLDA